MTTNIEVSVPFSHGHVNLKLMGETEMCKLLKDKLLYSIDIAIQEVYVEKQVNQIPANTRPGGCKGCGNN